MATIQASFANAAEFFNSLLGRHTNRGFRAAHRLGDLSAGLDVDRETPTGKALIAYRGTPRPRHVGKLRHRPSPAIAPEANPCLQSQASLVPAGTPWRRSHRSRRPGPRHSRSKRTLPHRV